MTSTCERCEATGKIVSLVNGECPKCSWMPPKRAKSNGGKQKTPQRNPKCSYAAGHLQCPLDATWYPNNRFSGYCALHDDEDKRKLPPWEAQAQLQRIHNDPISYARDLLEGSWAKERELLIQKHIAAYPEWQRGEDEGLSVYEDRMLDEIGKINPMMAAMIRRKRAGRAREVST